MSAPIGANPLIYFVIELQHSGLEVRLLLNGIELNRGGAMDKKIVQQKVNGWMTEAENQLALYAGIPERASISNPLDLKCLIFRGPQGRQPGEDEAIAKFAERDKAKLPAGNIQLVWKTTFPSNPFYGPWRWEGARPLSIDEPTVASAMQLLRSVVAYSSERDSASVVRLFRIYVEENARAYGMKVDRLEGQIRQMCESWSAVQPGNLVSNNYSFIVEENHRIMRVERKDGLPVFSCPESPGSGPVRVYISSLQEGLAIVR